MNEKNVAIDGPATGLGFDREKVAGPKNFSVTLNELDPASATSFGIQVEDIVEDAILYSGLSNLEAEFLKLTRNAGNPHSFRKRAEESMPENRSVSVGYGEVFS